jgi:hypothetical protein
MDKLFIFKCPITSQNVQGRLDDLDDVHDGGYRAIVCAACTRLHFFNTKTGKMMGQND